MVICGDHYDMQLSRRQSCGKGCSGTTGRRPGDRPQHERVEPGGTDDSLQLPEEREGGNKEGVAGGDADGRDYDH